jgi:hypothetical protein
MIVIARTLALPVTPIAAPKQRLRAVTLPPLMTTEPTVASPPSAHPPPIPEPLVDSA